MASNPLTEWPEIYRLTVETMVQGLAVLDNRAHILYANSALGELLETPVAELSGKPFVEFFDPKAQAVLGNQLTRRHKGEHGYYELPFTTPKGNRTVVLISAAPLLSESGSVDCSVAVLTDITGRKLAEEALLERHAQLRELSSELLLAEERERRRLASQLHDSIGHALVLAKIKLEDVQASQLDSGQSQVLSETMSLLETIIEETRSLTFEISPPILHELGLAAALEWLCDRTSKQHGLKVAVEHDEWAQRLGEDLRVLMFQASRELLFNVAKHAKAKTISVSLKRDQNWVSLSVSDDGIGFDVQAAAAKGRKAGGYGLFSIRERLSYVGGKLSIESGPSGTAITLYAPLTTEPAISAVGTASEEAPVTEIPRVKQQTGVIRLITADDQELMRQGLRTILEREPQIKIIAEAADGEKAVALARKLLPDVVVMDIDMPHINGIAATRILNAELPQIKVIALSMFADKQYVAEMLSAGAAGYLLKDCAGEDLVRAIHAVEGNLVFLSPAITDIVVKDFIHQVAPQAPSLDVLTSRERDVLKLLAEGESPKEIALELDINAKTVYTFRSSIMKKLGIDSMAELARFAIRAGLTHLDQ
jgi:PAS domain S-box-containing protein